MLTRLPGRLLLIAALFVATASFASRPSPAPLVVQAKSEMRVTRHFAAGLEYLLIEPRDLAPDTELPMVVVLHGRGGQPEPPSGPFLGLETPVRVIMPRGPLRAGDGYAWMPVSAHGGESIALNLPLERRMRELTSAMQTWQERHPTRGRPIVTGFSQGGILTATLAVQHPDSMYRAFPIAGWIPNRFAPDHYDPSHTQVPMHALHGADDRVIGAPRTRRQLSALRAMGYPVVYEEFEGAEHELTPEMLERLRVLIGRALREMPEAREAAGLS